MPEDNANPAEAAAPAPAAKTGGGFKAWLPLIVTAVVMPLLSYGTTQFVLYPRLKNELGGKTPTHSESGGSSSKKDSADTKDEAVVMNKLLVNVADTMGARYLLVSLSVTGNSADFKAKMTERDAQLRDMACGSLSTKTLADLEKPGERNLIRTELITGFNGILGDSVVKNIYLTEFAIQ